MSVVLYIDWTAYFKMEMSNGITYNSDKRNGFVVFKCDSFDEQKFYFESTVHVSVVFTDRHSENESGFYRVDIDDDSIPIQSLNKESCTELLTSCVVNEGDSIISQISSEQMVIKEEVICSDRIATIESAAMDQHQMSQTAHGQRHSPDIDEEDHGGNEQIQHANTNHEKILSDQHSPKTEVLEKDVCFSKTVKACTVCGFVGKTVNGLKVHEAAHSRRITNERHRENTNNTLKQCLGQFVHSTTRPHSRRTKQVRGQFVHSTARPYSRLSTQVSNGTVKDDATVECMSKRNKGSTNKSQDTQIFGQCSKQMRRNEKKYVVDPTWSDSESSDMTDEESQEPKERKAKTNYKKRIRDLDYDPGRASRSAMSPSDGQSAMSQPGWKKPKSKKRRQLLTCVLCNTEFHTLWKLKYHKRDVHGISSQKNYSCDVCHEHFTSVQHFKTHQKSHEASPSCDLCDEIFSSKVERDKHVKTHGIMCVICKESFSSHQLHKMHYTQQHMDAVDKTGKKILETCSLCSHSHVYFSKSHGLRKHHCCSHLPKTFVCDKCGKAFSQSYLLNRHLIGHMRKNSCVCSKCGQMFNCKRYLAIHIQRAHSVKKYRCNLCPKAFSMSCYLIKHMRSHTHERPFQCNLCPKAFTQKYNLNVHMRVHTNVKPFDCLICGHAFAHKCSLQGHMKSKH